MGPKSGAAEAAKGCGPKTEVGVVRRPRWVWPEDRGGCGLEDHVGGGGRASTGLLRLEVTWQAWTEVRMGVPLDDGSEPSDRFSTKRGSPSYTRTDP